FALCRKPRNFGLALESNMLLQMGSPAPPINVEIWLRREPIARFQPSKLYVDEFSATGTQPYAAAMRHLMQLQERFKDSGLETVGLPAHERVLTTVEARAKLDAVDPKVAKSEFPDRVRLHRRNGRALVGCQLFCRSSDLVCDRSRWAYPDRTR
ncbi:hypothetical protein RFN31_36125, partial [Mesorhizobium sp. VK3C]|nr:hypothetical protein [Mesorhizobium sp. VK3C]